MRLAPLFLVILLAFALMACADEPPIPTPTLEPTATPAPRPSSETTICEIGMVIAGDEGCELPKPPPTANDAYVSKEGWVFEVDMEGVPSLAEEGQRPFKPRALDRDFGPTTILMNEAQFLEGIGWVGRKYDIKWEVIEASPNGDGSWTVVGLWEILRHTLWDPPNTKVSRYFCEKGRTVRRGSDCEIPTELQNTTLQHDILQFVVDDDGQASIYAFEIVDIPVVDGELLQQSDQEIYFGFVVDECPTKRVAYDIFKAVANLRGWTITTMWEVTNVFDCP